MTYFLDPSYEDSLSDAYQQRRRASEVSRQNITPDVVDRITQLEQAYGEMDLPPGVIEALARSGFGADDLQSLQVAQLEQQAKEQEPDLSTWGRIKAGTRGAVRGTFTAFQSAFEEGVARPARTIFGAADLAAEEVGFETTNPLTGGVAKVAPGIEGISSYIRNLDDAYRQSGESTGVRVIRKWYNDEPVELGSGFIPRGLAEEARTEAEANLTFQGEPISLGRGAAVSFAEPGTWLYNLVSGSIDFAAQIAADPSYLGLKATTHIRDVRRTFGAVDAHRRSVDVQKFADDFLDKTTAGNNLSEDIADSDSFFDIWKMFDHNRGLRNHIRVMSGDAPLPDELAHLDMTRPGDVKEYLRIVLGREIRERPTDPRSALSMVRRSLDDLDRLPIVKRLVHDVPRSRINVEDLDDATVQLDQWMVNATLPTDVRRKHIDALANAREGDALDVWNVVKNVADDVDTHLQTEWGRDSGITRKLTTIFADEVENARIYYAEEIGGQLQNAYAPGQKINIVDGVASVDQSAHIIPEYINREIPLPNVREIRRAASHIGPIMEALGVTAAHDVVSNWMTKGWKPLQIIRPAFTVRVSGEEQVRLAGAGLDSGFSHPGSWLAWVIGMKSESRKRVLETIDSTIEQARKTGATGAVSRAKRAKRTAQFGERLEDIVGAKGMTDINGVMWDEIAEHQDNLRRGAGGWFGSQHQALTSGGMVDYRKGDDLFFEAASAELRQLANEPIAQRLARGDNTVDEIKDAFWDGDLEPLRRKLAQGTNREKQVFVDDAIARQEGQKAFDAGFVEQPYTNAREASDAYVDTVMRRLREKTGGHPDLIRAVADRELAGSSLRYGQGSIARQLEAYEDALPAVVKGPRAVKGEGPSFLDRFTQSAFEVIGSAPSNILNVSPAHRQFYWDRIAELGQFMDEGLRTRMVAAAKDNNLTDIATKLSRTRGRTGPRALNQEQIDDIAKAHALKKTRDLLYEMDRRGQWADIARVIFPFGEAFKEVISRWTRLAVERPQNIRRGQQAIEGARGSGFFYTDENGNERFNYPAFGLTGAVAGGVLGGIAGGLGGGPVGAAVGAGVGAIGLGAGAARASFVGDVAAARPSGYASGLNLVALTLVPGVGPVVQWPAAMFLDSARFDWVQDIILPFGEERAEADTLGELIDNNMPAWSRDVLQGLSQGAIDQHQWQNTVGEIARAKMVSGEYDNSQIQEAHKDAARQAAFLYTVKGLARAVLPTGPSIDFQAQDKNGNWAKFQSYAWAYRQLLDEFGGDQEQATQMFMEKFGLDPMLLSAPTSKTINIRSFHKSGAAWEARHPELVDKYRDVIGLFAPGDPDVDEFDHEAFLDAIDAKDRLALTAEEQLLYMNNNLGMAQYHNVKKKLEERFGESKKLDHWLRVYKAKLKDEYPGYDTINKKLGKSLSTDEQIDKLIEAVQDPQLAETDAGQALTKYLKARDAMVERAHGVGLGGKTDERLRAILHVYGSKLAEENPEFVEMWHRVLMREVEE